MYIAIDERSVIINNLHAYYVEKQARSASIPRTNIGGLSPCDLHGPWADVHRGPIAGYVKRIEQRLEEVERALTFVLAQDGVREVLSGPEVCVVMPTVKIHSSIRSIADRSVQITRQDRKRNLNFCPGPGSAVRMVGRSRTGNGRRFAKIPTFTR